MKTNADSEYPTLTFRNPEEFEDWLFEHHQKTEGIWLKIYKKAADKKGITRIEALDEALCYGWIDGQAKKLDEESYLQKFTPRRSGSLWSKRNTEHIDRLINLGKMKPAGVREVEEAKADGRWEKAYDPPSEMTVPKDFLEELSKHPKAKEFFKSLNKTNTYAITWRLQTAKKPETRQRRMKKILKMLSDGKKFH
ncbi:bacteriocin-protection protein, YdeI/OmpD-associated family [Rhodohalobacter sp. SW132]|uniref:YdeI/OmpD-associated family protein n=1 Tax=Rhodohalobacter sp. SW132 TaxID=2293433 RepID=UPI000E229717|nr:YdeI/OmpD-associated family protein [Rhodohalobacter sp. SW132]REL24029.1 bacteriocin-protection protein, YdeI/OmpD-associated family [Rhodohalobacter sp. SW132]